jgi:glycine C-acetyltransferase
VVDSNEGQQLLTQLAANVQQLKREMTAAGFKFAAESVHPIQAVLIGDTAKTKALAAAMYERGFLITNINYPVVPKGRDEIRVQLSARHSSQEVSEFVAAMTEAAKTF